MKRARLLSLAAVTFFAVHVSSAEPEPAPAPVPAPSGQDAHNYVLRVETGKPVTFTIPENVTTGFRWMAKYDAALCKVEIGHRGPETPGNPPVCGAPGKAVIKCNYFRLQIIDAEGRHAWTNPIPIAQP